MGTEKITIEISEHGARLVGRSIEDIGKHAKAAHDPVEFLKKALEFAGLALTLREIVQRTAEFQTALTRAGIAAGATRDQMAGLGDATKRLGLETGAGAIEAAKSLGILARSGLATANSVGALKDALELAQSTGEGAASATEALARTVQAFGVEGKRAADVLATGFFRSNESLGELTSALAKSAPAARQAGLSLEDTGAAVLTLARSGAEGRLVVHELSAALEALENPVAADRAAFRVLGLDLDKIRPSMSSLAIVAEELGKGGGRFEALGVRGGKALDILAKRKDDVASLATALKESGGNAAKFAATLEDTVGGSLEKLKASVDDLIISFGVEGGIAGAIKLIATGVGGLADKIKDLRAELKELRAGFPSAFKAGAELQSVLDRTGSVFDRHSPAAPLPLTTTSQVLQSSLTFAGTPTASDLNLTNDQQKIATTLTTEYGEARKRLLDTETALGELRRADLITTEQANAALAKAIQEAGTAAGAFDAFRGQILAVDSSTAQLSRSLGDVLVGAVDQLSDALADLAINGFRTFDDFKKAVSDLLRSLAKEILKLIIQALILKSIKAALGVGSPAEGAVSAIVGGASAAGGGGGGFASGGDVQEGVPILVGERGPELFKPPSHGEIVPNSQIGGAAQPAHITNIIQFKEEDITGLILTSHGQKNVMNVILQNRAAIRAALDGG